MNTSFSFSLAVLTLFLSGSLRAGEVVEYIDVQKTPVKRYKPVSPEEVRAFRRFRIGYSPFVIGCEDFWSRAGLKNNRYSKKIDTLVKKMRKESIPADLNGNPYQVKTAGRKQWLASRLETPDEDAITYFKSILSNEPSLWKALQKKAVISGGFFQVDEFKSTAINVVAHMMYAAMINRAVPAAEIIDEKDEVIKKEKADKEKALNDLATQRDVARSYLNRWTQETDRLRQTEADRAEEHRLKNLYIDMHDQYKRQYSNEKEKVDNIEEVLPFFLQNVEDLKDQLKHEQQVSQQLKQKVKAEQAVQAGHIQVREELANSLAQVQDLNQKLSEEKNKTDRELQRKEAAVAGLARQVKHEQEQQENKGREAAVQARELLDLQRYRQEISPERKRLMKENEELQKELLEKKRHTEKLEKLLRRLVLRDDAAPVSPEEQAAWDKVVDF